MNSRTIIQQAITQKRERLQLYLDREQSMLTDGVQSYGLGTRNLARYQTDLKAIQDMIAKLQEEIEELEGSLCGCRPRKAVGVVPRDW